MLHAVIMAGGSGTRFWPQSRRALPKQLIPIAGERTMIQETVARANPWIPAERTWVVTNALQAGETARQLPELSGDHVLIEPCGRNTAPCIGLAAIQVLAADPDATMLVMPADHAIRPPEVFRESVERAASLLEQNPERLVLFGVSPTYPATGYGYIERGSPLAEAQAGAYEVRAFKEKPQIQTAREYVEAGTYYWNCGIFVWKARRILEALGQFEPEIHERLCALREHVGTPDWESALEREFPAMKSISIDYAVLERAGQVAVLEAPFEWDDVGSWLALPRLLGTDEAGNTVDGLHCGIETRGCIIRSSGDHLVATIGLEDCIVVQTPRATLVARKQDEEAIRQLIAKLEAEGHERFL